ncbi:hypothetical protein RI049_19370 [Cedecea neteri]|uniref:hypothetical protein n=1 Tax=Cedecea neteri TaxID=158822 RepID=UPI002AA9284B|nr:hypothetical protein [Cedecea neteri]WPU22179.1 hypothetical protein RI049_19370 [Cedecea neteri]
MNTVIHRKVVINVTGDAYPAVAGINLYQPAAMNEDSRLLSYSLYMHIPDGLLITGLPINKRPVTEYFISVRQINAKSGGVLIG